MRDKTKSTPGGAVIEPVYLLAAQQLITELQTASQVGESHARLVATWDETLRFFRTFETQHLTAKDPGPIDLVVHKALLELLIGLGRILETKITDQDFETFGIVRGNLTASIQELQDSFTMWHAPLPESIVAGLKDIEEGREVDLDIALTHKPPGA